MIHPASDCFVRNCNSALGEQILDVAKAEGETEIEPDRLVNDLRRKPISGVADFHHALWLPSRRRRDNALSTHAAVFNTFNVQRHLTSAQSHRTLRNLAMRTWLEATAA
jgi:hypothetical protein